MRIEKKINECSGCGACAMKCPKHAIIMQSDNMGFLYPVVDEKLCVDCGLCLKICNFKKQNNSHKPLKVYAGRLNNLDLLSKSQSGGVFWALASCIINGGGVVYGAAFTEDFYVSHIRADSLASIELLRGSKYIQSKVFNVYPDVLTDLKQGHLVLFTGTPCQISGLLSYLGPKSYDNLYTVDLVCHGVPSPAVWNDYVKWIENKKKTKIIGCNFRDKSFGWGSHVETFNFKDDKKISASIFKELFYRHLVIRESCHNCPFTNLSRHSDITIGDYWGWENISDRFCDSKGVSLIIINTQKGFSLIEKSKNMLLLEPSNTRECLQPQLQYPASRPVEKDKFISDYKNNGFDYVIYRYAIIGFRKKIRDLREYIELIFKKINFHINKMIK